LVNGQAERQVQKVGTVMKLPAAGGTPATLASGQHETGAIAVDATSVYWTAAGTGSNDGTIMRLTPK
jgi:hypothetical protein